MKPINFITTLSPEKHYAIKRWFIVSLFLCIILSISLIVVSIPHITTVLSLKQEIKNLRKKTEKSELIEKQYKDILAEQEILKKKQKKINTIVDHRKNSYNYLPVIVQTSADIIKIEHVRFSKESIELTILCKSPEHASTYINQLSASELFAHVKLTSLVQDTQTKQIRCTIKGTLQS